MRSWSALFLLVLGCGGAKPAPESPAQVQQPEEGTSLHARFEQAYFEVACMANAGRDPELTITPLKKPLDYLEGLEAEKSPRLSRALSILANYGFMSTEHFRQVEMKLRSEPDWWNSHIDNQFIDRLKACK